MNATVPDHSSPWAMAVHAAALLSVDVFGTRGVNLRARAGRARDVWMETLRQLLPESSTLRRIPHHVSDAALLGGLDLAATLRCGRPVAERGLLARANGGIVVLSSAERTPPTLAVRIAEALDTHYVASQRNFLDEQYPARIGVVLLDEGLEDERPPGALLDRVAFHIDLDAVRCGDATDLDVNRHDVAAAQARLHQVKASAEVVRILCQAASALGIISIRAPLLAMRAARAAAALGERLRVSNEDVALAAALVLAPRATVLPAPEATRHNNQTSQSDASDYPSTQHDDECFGNDQNSRLDDVIIEAARAAIPAGLLKQLKISDTRKVRSETAGRAGVLLKSSRSGRPAGVRHGELSPGVRLNLVETLRTAAPWQVLRRREAAQSQRPSAPARRIEIRRDDFRLTRLVQRSETTTIFVVDASGSSAFNRLAEAKGAVEQLLIDSYIRRDHVALLAFRGTKVELVLPPTRSLARAKRSLAGLPGGGTTPLPHAIDAALTLADMTRRKGQTPVIAFLTDGGANVARDGRPGRAQAQQDAMQSARMMRAANLAILVIDISPHPHAPAERLASEMGARYLPLPYANPKALSLAVQTALRRGQSGG
jgi:magnesium chelatase subunit D